MLTKSENTKSASRSPVAAKKRNTPFFQPKLQVRTPGDKYEAEADKVADHVVNDIPGKQNSFIMPSVSPSIQTIQSNPIPITPISESISSSTQAKEEKYSLQKQSDEEEEQIQMQSEEEEEEEVVQMQSEEEEEEEEELQTKQEENIEAQKEEEEPVQMQPEEEEEIIQMQPEEEEEPVQMQSEEEDEAIQMKIQKSDDINYIENPTALKEPKIETEIKKSKGNGSSLPSDFQKKMQDNLNVDLSGVKIHTDSSAVKANKKLKAQAFTQGNDIYFNEGKFNPASKDGQHLLAHELTHTVQQGAVQPLSNKKETGSSENEEAQAQESITGIKTEPSNSIESFPANKAILEDKPTNEISTNTKGEKGQSENKKEGLNGKEKLAAQTGAIKGKDQKEESAYPTSPEEDPKFKAIKQKVKKEAGGQRSHNSAQAESQAAQNAAVSPANERESQAQASQVETMNQQEPGEFDAVAFKAKLMERISNMQLPENQEEAADFENNNNIDDVNQAAQQDVQSEQAAAAGDIEQTTEQNPNTESIPERQVQELPPANIGNTPPPVGAASAMPDQRPESQVSQPLRENMQEVDQTMAENEISDEQLAKSNEPSFNAALSAKKEAHENTQNAPGQFRQEEQQTLSASQQEAQAGSQAQLQGMHADRQTVLSQVVGQQVNTGTQDTSERTRIANEINLIYEQTKIDVENILNALDESVSTMFTNAAERAKEKFESYVEDRMDAYKERRYSGLIGKGRWVKDKFLGVPDEVNVYFTEGRQIYIDEMDVALTNISQHVAEKLTEAKNRIATGKQKVSDYVAALPESLQSMGREAAENIQNRFDELESSVDAKQDELIDSLAQQYVQSLQEVDSRIEEMKAANRGLVDKALDAVKGVIQTIINIKNTLTNLLSSAISIIKTIITDPIGFLGNLISGITQGFKNFGSNILKHLTSGLIGWLTGALGPMGINIPDNLFSLKGIFSLVMQILGLTWDYIRRKAVKLLGEPVVAALEKGFEIFQIIKKEGISGLWNYIKEQFKDLKETVIGAIKEMVITKVIEAGIKWVLGLMNPAGAFIKAAMMIIDIVKFFIERGRQIIQLVQAFIEGVKAVASGSVAKVAQAIENALAKAIPVVIGFLASLLGITGLASKVQNLIKKIRKRIDKAIDKVIMKAKSWFRKAGSKIKGAAAKFFKWWKNKKTFKDKNGKNHKLYFKGEGSAAVLTVASNPTPLTSFLTAVNTGGNAEKQAAKTKALTLSNEIDTLKSTPVTGSNETEKSKKSKEVDDTVKTKMNALVPLINKLMGGEEKSVDLLKVYLNKKVTNEDGTVKQSFINDFTSDKNKLDGKMVYVYQEDGKIVRGRNRAQEGFMSIRISDEEGSQGILLPGAEKKYTPPHNLFKPEDIKMTYSGGVYQATYKTNQSTGEGKQNYTVDVTFDQVKNGIPDKTEHRTVKGENMVKKPDGMVRGSTDSAGGGFDNAHLIGDRFGGSGYNQALNIYPSSEKFNRVTMLNKENSLFKGLSSASTFEMTVKAKILHEAGKSSNPESHLQILLDGEFKKENSGKDKDQAIENGFVKKMRKEIAKDIKGIPGKFTGVDYSAKQPGKSLSYSIGEDTDYERAVKQKLGS